MPFTEGRSEWAQFWKTLSPRAHWLFLAGVFFMFFTSGLLMDIASLGGNSVVRLLANAILSGGLAMAYVVVVRYKSWWFIPLIASHILIASQFDKVFGHAGAPLVGEALRTRMQIDVNVTTVSIILSFVLLSQLIRTQGANAGALRAEIRLARDIHRRLVPRISSRIGEFEFHGVSVPSGEVGGDLIDLVETANGWTCLVSDVSGHGVGAGLLMGMVKSASRTRLREGATFDQLLTTINAVLFDLKNPAMFATFAGLQRGADDATLHFTVAGHLPILHYRARTGDVVEVTIAQLPLAMFPDTAFTGAEVPCEAGDLFLLLTDGLTEVFDRPDQRGEEFGLDRVKSLLREQATAAASLEVIEQQLLAEVRAHGTQHDDQTLFLVRRDRR
jgi:serine phosphatase RsbU (regulator of sigma subunit)